MHNKASWPTLINVKSMLSHMKSMHSATASHSRKHLAEILTCVVYS